MFKISDFYILQDIFKKELLSVRGAYHQHCIKALCQHYLEDKVFYPIHNKNNSNYYYRSDIPLFVKKSQIIRDYLYEIIEITNGSANVFMTFHEYLYHTWIFFEKAVFKNIIYCIKNYSLSPEQQKSCEAIAEIEEGHVLYDELRKVSLDIFVDSLNDMLNLNFENAMLNTYGDYDVNPLNLRLVLKYRRLPFSYQDFVISLFDETPSFIAFRTLHNETLITWNPGDDVLEYVQDCLRNLRRLQREGGAVVATDRSNLCMGSENPIRLYASKIFRARPAGLVLVNQKTEAYKSTKTESGTVKTQLLPKARKA